METTCSECRRGTLRPGVVTINKTTQTRVYSIQVPGDVCEACGEASISQRMQTQVIDRWSEAIDSREAAATA